MTSLFSPQSVSSTGSGGGEILTASRTKLMLSMVDDYSEHQVDDGSDFHENNSDNQLSAVSISTADESSEDDLIEEEENVVDSDEEEISDGEYHDDEAEEGSYYSEDDGQEEESYYSEDDEERSYYSEEREEGAFGEEEEEEPYDEDENDHHEDSSSHQSQEDMNMSSTADIDLDLNDEGGYSHSYSEDAGFYDTTDSDGSDISDAGSSGSFKDDSDEEELARNTQANSSKHYESPKQLIEKAKVLQDKNDHASLSSPHLLVQDPTASPGKEKAENTAKRKEADGDGASPVSVRFDESTSKLSADSNHSASKRVYSRKLSPAEASSIIAAKQAAAKIAVMEQQERQNAKQVETPEESEASEESEYVDDYLQSDSESSFATSDSESSTESRRDDDDHSDYSSDNHPLSSTALRVLETANPAAAKTIEKKKAREAKEKHAASATQKPKSPKVPNSKSKASSKPLKNGAKAPPQETAKAALKNRAGDEPLPANEASSQDNDTVHSKLENARVEKSYKKPKKALSALYASAKAGSSSTQQQNVKRDHDDIAENAHIARAASPTPDTSSAANSQGVNGTPKSPKTRSKGKGKKPKESKSVEIKQPARHKGKEVEVSKNAVEPKTTSPKTQPAQPESRPGSDPNSNEIWRPPQDALDSVKQNPAAEEEGSVASPGSSVGELESLSFSGLNKPELGSKNQEKLERVEPFKPKAPSAKEKQNLEITTSGGDQHTETPTKATKSRAATDPSREATAASKKSDESCPGTQQAFHETPKTSKGTMPSKGGRKVPKTPKSAAKTPKKSKTPKTPKKQKIPDLPTLSEDISQDVAADHKPKQYQSSAPPAEAAMEAANPFETVLLESGVKVSSKFGISPAASNATNDGTLKTPEQPGSSLKSFGKSRPRRTRSNFTTDKSSEKTRSKSFDLSSYLREKVEKEAIDQQTIDQKREARKQQFRKDRENRAAIKLQAAARGYLFREQNTFLPIRDASYRRKPNRSYSSSSNSAQLDRGPQRLGRSASSSDASSLSFESLEDAQQKPMKRSIGKSLKKLIPFRRKSSNKVIDDAMRKRLQKSGSQGLSSSSNGFDKSQYLRQKRERESFEQGTKTVAQMREERLQAARRDKEVRETSSSIREKSYSSCKATNNASAGFDKSNNLRERKEREQFEREIETVSQVRNEMQGAARRDREYRDVSSILDKSASPRTPARGNGFDRSNYIREKREREQFEQQTKTVSQMREERLAAAMRDRELREASSLQEGSELNGMPPKTPVGERTSIHRSGIPPVQMFEPETPGRSVTSGLTFDQLSSPTARKYSYEEGFDSKQNKKSKGLRRFIPWKKSKKGEKTPHKQTKSKVALQNVPEEHIASAPYRYYETDNSQFDRESYLRNRQYKETMEPKTVAQMREERQIMIIRDRERREATKIQAATRGYIVRKSLKLNKKQPNSTSRRRSNSNRRMSPALSLEKIDSAAERSPRTAAFARNNTDSFSNSFTSLDSRGSVHALADAEAAAREAEALAEYRQVSTELTSLRQKRMNDIPEDFSDEEGVVIKSKFKGHVRRKLSNMLKMRSKKSSQKLNAAYSSQSDSVERDLESQPSRDSVDRHHRRPSTVKGEKYRQMVARQKEAKLQEDAVRREVEQKLKALEEIRDERRQLNQRETERKALEAKLQVIFKRQHPGRTVPAEYESPRETTRSNETQSIRTSPRKDWTSQRESLIQMSKRRKELKEKGRQSERRSQKARQIAKIQALVRGHLVRKFLDFTTNSLRSDDSPSLADVKTSKSPSMIESSNITHDSKATENLGAKSTDNRVPNVIETQAKEQAVPPVNWDNVTPDNDWGNVALDKKETDTGAAKNRKKKKKRGGKKKNNQLATSTRTEVAAHQTSSNPKHAQLNKTQQSTPATPLSLPPLAKPLEPDLDMESWILPPPVQSEHEEGSVASSVTAASASLYSKGTLTSTQASSVWRPNVGSFDASYLNRPRGRVESADYWDAVRDSYLLSGWESKDDESAGFTSWAPHPHPPSKEKSSESISNSKTLDDIAREPPPSLMDSSDSSSSEDSWVPSHSKPAAVDRGMRLDFAGNTIPNVKDNRRPSSSRRITSDRAINADRALTMKSVSDSSPSSSAKKAQKQSAAANSQTGDNSTSDSSQASMPRHVHVSVNASAMSSERAKQTKERRQGWDWCCSTSSAAVDDGEGQL